MRTLDMKFIRYLNLFEKITKVRTKNCFAYNFNIVFAVSRNNVSRAIGENGKHVKKISEIIGKKVKVVFFPENIEEARDFISSIVSPVSFKNLEVRDDEIVISASQQSKAALIGRNKRRLEEMKEIIKQYFNKKLRIV